MNQFQHTFYNQQPQQNPQQPPINAQGPGPQQQQSPANSATMDPAVLAAYQQRAGMGMGGPMLNNMSMGMSNSHANGSINPAMLSMGMGMGHTNGMGGMTANGMHGMNPMNMNSSTPGMSMQQQQQQQQQMQQNMGGMQMNSAYGGQFQQQNSQGTPHQGNQQTHSAAQYVNPAQLFQSQQQQGQPQSQQQQQPQAGPAQNHQGSNPTQAALQAHSKAMAMQQAYQMQHLMGGQHQQPHGGQPQQGQMQNPSHGMSMQGTQQMMNMGANPMNMSMHPQSAVHQNQQPGQMQSQHPPQQMQPPRTPHTPSHSGNVSMQAMQAQQPQRPSSVASVRSVHSNTGGPSSAPQSTNQPPSNPASRHPSQPPQQHGQGFPQQQHSHGQQQPSTQPSPQGHQAAHSHPSNQPLNLNFPRGGMQTGMGVGTMNVGSIPSQGNPGGAPGIMGPPPATTRSSVPLTAPPQPGGPPLQRSTPGPNVAPQTPLSGGSPMVNGVNLGMRASKPPVGQPQPQQQLPVAQDSRKSASQPPQAAVPGPSSLPPQSLPPPLPTLRLQPPAKPLPPLDLARTKIVAIPREYASEHIPPLSDSEVTYLKEVMARDRSYQAVHIEMKDRMKREEREILGGPVGWFERDPRLPGGGAPSARERGRQEKFQPWYPVQKRDKAMKLKKMKGRALEIKLPRKLPDQQANAPELLVPVRLEFDVDAHKFKESFVWNLSDTIIRPEDVAQSLVDDFKLGGGHHQAITRSIIEQLSDFRSHMGEGIEKSELKRGSLDDGEELEWWSRWRKKLRTTNGYVRRSVETRSNQPALVAKPEEVPHEKSDSEFRVLLKLDVVVGTMKLDDQFEWDILDENNSPERFADVYVNELGLSGEFKTAIVHSIREQLAAFHKSLFLFENPPAVASIADAELKEFFLPTVTAQTVARSAELASSYTPFLNTVDELELALSAEREKNRKKRQRQNNRRRANIIPEKDAIRTHRTPAIGFPDVDPMSLINGAFANSGPTTSKRAAAAAASVTIANMVASENENRPMPPPMTDRIALSIAPAPQLPPPPAPEPKRPSRGLFKGPPVPPALLRPRAKMSHTIPSTAFIEHSSIAPPPREDEDGGQALISLTGERRNNKTPNAKRLKEMEREEKEREYAKRQHANMIDGVWHCSNCGCPESIAVGRRKGPLGEKSQCGDCGKYYHRYRKPREVVYNTDPDHHIQLRDGTSRKRAKPTLDVAPTPLEELSPAPPDSPTLAKEELPDDNDQASSRGSSSEPLIKQSVKRAAGEDRIKAKEEALPDMLPKSPAIQNAKPSGTAESASPSDATTSKKEASAEAGHSDGQARPMPVTLTTDPADQPDWLKAEWAAMSIKFPDDRVEPLLRRSAEGSTEWWIRCLDCPGKFYKTGPEQTLNNFEVHLKNRNHRKKVLERTMNNG